MIDPRTLPQFGSPIAVDSYGTGAGTHGNNDSDLYARVLTTAVQLECVGEVPDLRANESNGARLGMGK